MGCAASEGHSVKYAYWGVRGFGQIGRLLLAYLGANWEDIKYTSPPAWFQEDKEKLGLPFPNLPYLIDGQFKLTETKAIYHYIIRKSGRTELLGKDIKDRARVECLVSAFGDVKAMYQPLVFDPDWSKKVEEVSGKLIPKLDEYAKCYGQKDFALGYLTLADFYIVEGSYHIEKIFPQVYAKYPFLKRVRTVFENLPEIRTYYASQKAVKAPFFSPQAAIKI